MKNGVKYKRVLLKISGEALAGENKIGINDNVLKEISANIKAMSDLGVEVGIVVGGGNFWRGRSSEQMDRVTADHMGMLATLMNALALSDALEQQGAVTRVLSAIEVRQMCETYIRKRAVRHLEKGRIVIFACGTGNPYFTTDTCAALRANEVGCDAILMAKNGVEGVYSDDPRKNPNAEFYSKLTYSEMLAKNLSVMDNAALSLCINTNIELRVFNMADMKNFGRVIAGENIGTTITKGE